MPGLPHPRLPVASLLLLVAALAVQTGAHLYARSSAAHREQLVCSCSSLAGRPPASATGLA